MIEAARDTSAESFDDGSSCSSVSSFESSSTPSKQTRKIRIGSWRSSTSDFAEIQFAALEWRNSLLRHVWDVDFMKDGTILVVAGEEAHADANVVTVYHRKLHALNLAGNPKSLPFQEHFVDPSGVSVCRSSGSVAVTDRPGEEPRGTVSVLRKHGQNWKYRTHTAQNTAMRLGLTSSDVAACAVRWEKLVKYTAGQKSWAKSISSSNDLTPFVAIDISDNIIVSTPANNRVSTINPKGDLVSVFPTWFIKKPTGVCVDSVGRVYVADKTNNSISQFTEQGHFLQKIVKLDVEPRCISMYRDVYLAVGTNFHGLFLYKLEWED